MKVAKKSKAYKIQSVALGLATLVFFVGFYLNFFYTGNPKPREYSPNVTDPGVLKILNSDSDEEHKVAVKALFSRSNAKNILKNSGFKCEKQSEICTFYWIINDEKENKFFWYFITLTIHYKYSGLTRLHETVNLKNISKSTHIFDAVEDYSKYEFRRCVGTISDSDIWCDSWVSRR